MSRRAITRRDWGSDDTGAHILHVDMDSFFASVEILDDPARDHDWGISAEVDLAASDAEGAAVVRVTRVDRL